jgi:pyruvate formate lyase activating enzyme
LNERGIRLGGIVDISTIDWYGNVSSVIFFAGCNFRCPYCQNANLIPLDSGKNVNIEYVRSRLSDQKNLIDAVVVSGGEPLLQPEGIMILSNLANELGLKVMINTNGSRPKVIKELLENGYVDRVALDLKAPLTASYYAPFLATESSKTHNEVKKSLEIFHEQGIDLEIRTTVAPGISDKPSFIRAIAEDIKGYSMKYILQQFDNMGEILNPELKMKAPLKKSTLENLANIASSIGLKEVYIKTRKEGLERL